MMKKKISLLFIIVLCACNVHSQYRIDNKQKAELLRNGDVNIIQVENVLNENEIMLNLKKPDTKLNDPTVYINIIASSKIKYKNICIECYVSEYNNQLHMASIVGLTNPNERNIIAESFFDQSGDSIKILFDCIVSESKRKFTFFDIKTINKQNAFRYIDEATRDNFTPTLIAFAVNVTNKGNKHLEIFREDRYRFSYIRCKYLDLAGFWIKYINKNISIKELADKGKDEYIFKINEDTHHLIFAERNDGWEIRAY